MGTVGPLTSSGSDKPEGIRLISSIRELPYHRVDTRAVYAVSGEAMNEILGELQQLWSARETLATLVASREAPSTG